MCQKKCVIMRQLATWPLFCRHLCQTHWFLMVFFFILSLVSYGLENVWNQFEDKTFDINVICVHWCVGRDWGNLNWNNKFNSCILYEKILIEFWRWLFYWAIDALSELSTYWLIRQYYWLSSGHFKVKDRSCTAPTRNKTWIANNYLSLYRFWGRFCK